MKAHFDNDIWKKREQPPDDWSKPLPEFMEKRNENSYLEVKSKEFIAEQERQDQEIKELAAANTTNATELKSKTNTSNFCTFM